MSCRSGDVLVVLCGLAGGLGLLLSQDHHTAAAASAGSPASSVPAWLAADATPKAATTRTATGAEVMINVPVSTKVAALPWPRPGVPDFTLVVRSNGGAMLGTDLREFDHTIQVDARRALVSIESFRSPTDIAGQPLGLFRMNVDDAQLREVHRLVGDTKLFTLQPSMQGHPGYTQTRYTIVEQNTRLEQLINDDDHETNGRLQVLPQMLNTWLAKGFAHPERAAVMGIKRVSVPAGEAFEVSITNIGIERICFADPRWIAATGPLQQATVLVSEYTPVAPGEPASLSWFGVALPAMSPRPAREPIVILDPKAVWTTTTEPWRKAPGKRYLAYFTWAYYPGEPMVNGVYRIRGRADSVRLVIEP